MEYQIEKICKFDQRMFSAEAVRAACYKFSGKYYINIELNDEENLIRVTFTSKSGKINENEVNEFYNTVLDEQVRIDVDNKFSHIRDLIVEEAFKPVSK